MDISRYSAVHAQWLPEYVACVRRGLRTELGV